MPATNDKNEPNGSLSSSKTTVPTEQRSESDVYDRQIRLWGADAQAKMSKAKVLYIHMTGVSSEILKNLVLAGIPAALCDVRIVQDHTSWIENTPSFFFATARRRMAAESSKTIAEWVQPAIEELNPLLGTCPLVSWDISDLTPEILSPFSVVVASQITPQQALELANKLSSVKSSDPPVLFWVDTFGWYGSCWVDYTTNHRFYSPEKGKELLEPLPLLPYVSLEDMYRIPLHLAVNRFHKTTPPPPLAYHKTLLAFFQQQQQQQHTTTQKGDDNHRDLNPSTRLGDHNAEFCDFVRNHWLPSTSPSLLDHPLFSEMALKTITAREIIPVCSVMGGLVGNEIIKVLSGKGCPANNTISFDGMTCKGWHFLLQPTQRRE